MELLTPAGWNATFSIEAILEQVRAHLVFGKGKLELPAVLRSATPASSSAAGLEGAPEANAEAKAEPLPDAVDPSPAQRAAAEQALSSSYSAAASQRGMQHIIKFHDARGWASAGKS